VTSLSRTSGKHHWAYTNFTLHLNSANLGFESKSTTDIVTTTYKMEEKIDSIHGVENNAESSIDAIQYAIGTEILHTVSRDAEVDSVLAKEQRRIM
jgi:hypothetical protein